MKFTNYIIGLLLLSSSYTFSQQISVDDTVGLQQLIESNLVSGCVSITNISSNVNGNSVGFPSYASFERGSSNFPFDNGIMLSTGAAASGGNTAITPTLSDTATNWGTDNDIESALGITNTTNATSIEFDFVSAYNQLQFNYIFASEEYVDDNSCNSGDSFVILIKEASSSGPFQNIALVPGTSDYISVSNIREEINPISCPEQNNQYFDGFALGDTNFEGRTTMLTASTSITPETTYRIKLIIADQPDGSFDSAVFIQNNTFNTPVDLGPDIETCSTTTTLNADIQIPSATFEWYRNNELIPSASNSSYNVMQDGTYRAVVSLSLNGEPCTVEDEINIALNIEIPVLEAEPFVLCDDPNNGMGEEIFTLNQHDLAIGSISPFTNTSITYFESDTDARDLNNIGITSANNLTTPTIFARLYDIDNDCYAYTSFSLLLTPLPTVVTPTNLNICDEDGNNNGITNIDLSIKDSEITNDQADLVVTYHTTENGADDGDDSIPNKIVYRNTNTPQETIYVRVTDTITNCFSAPIPLTINIDVAPDVNTTVPIFIDACDRDLDGFANFNLNQVIDDFVGTLTNYTPYFYENFIDARAGNSNFIQNPANFINSIINDQTIYLRIEDDTTGCATVVSFEIHTNLLLTGTNLAEFVICDNDTDSTNPLDFNLLAIEIAISNDLPNPVTVTFYENEDDRTNNIEINKDDPYPVIETKTLFVKLEDGNCTEESEIILSIIPLFAFQPIEPVFICDTDIDGTVDIDLHDLDGLTTNQNPDFVASYFLSNFNANNNIGEIQTYFNASGTVEVFVRLSNLASGGICYTVGSFEINVLPAPTTNTPVPNPICDTLDGDPNGFSVFDLNTVINDLVSDPTGLNIQFFTTNEAATIGDAIDSNPDWIPSDQWNTFITGTQEIFARIESPDIDVDCTPFSIESFFIYVNTKPIIGTDLELKVCKNANETNPNIVFEDYDNLILNGQTGKEVFYYFDSSFNNLIPKTSSINSFNGDVYIRVENITDPSGCFTTATIPIVILENPSYNTPITPLAICEANSGSNHIFNLETKAGEIRATSTEVLNITFHKLQSNAENNIQDITDSSNYPGEDNEVLYIRIERDDTKCALIEPLTLFVFLIPETTDASPYNQCDYDADPYDGETTFNLTNVEGVYFEVLERFQNSITVHYFNTLDDINQDNSLDNSNAIPSSQLSAFTTESTTIYIKITNTITTCYKIIPLELNVIAPPVFNDTVEILECYDDSNTFDLTQANNLLVNDLTTVSITYHLSENDAEINQGIYVNNVFDYSTPGDYIISVRIEDVTAPNCVSTTSFILTILPNPIANTPPNFVTCDDDYDGAFEFRLSDNNINILGTQNEDLFSITYYSSLANAQNKFEQSSDLYMAENGEIIYARIENNSTECFATTQFITIVNPLPIIAIDDIIPLCLDDLPLFIDVDTGDSNDAYLWSTTVNPNVNNATSSSIEVFPTEFGAYTVTITTPNNCQTIKTFEVIESEQAEITFTTEVHFQDPNSITININENRIGNYVYLLDNEEQQTSNIFDNVTFGMHTVTVRDLNGCMDATKEVFVFDIPKFVTPNNDSYFDTWHIIGVNQLPGTLVYIFDRYGKLLKTLTHTSIGWDGTFNGQNMPSGDYWFVAKVIQNDEAFDVKGHFALKR